MKKMIIRENGLIGKILKGINFLTRRDLRKNKIYSLLLMLIGYVSMLLLEGDCTVFILTLILGVPVFFSKRNVIM